MTDKPLDLALLSHGGTCPTCRRKLRPVRRPVEVLSALFTASMNQLNRRAVDEGWTKEQLAEHLLVDLRPRFKDLTTELLCLVGLCGYGSETWG